MGIILCNGYVTESPFLKLKHLIINIVLCNGYVTKAGIGYKVLFD